MALTSLSPLDGRYHKDVSELSDYFSEMALMQYRLMVEVEYFIALSLEPGVKEVKAFNPATQKQLRSIYANFSLADAEKIKKIESVTNHDVKAVEYFLKEKILSFRAKPRNRLTVATHTGQGIPPLAATLGRNDSECEILSEFIHFALTSEDINNLAYSVMWQTAVRKVYKPKINEVIKQITAFARAYGNTPLLALTHGQSATPTTMGKEFAVFSTRLNRQIKQLEKHQLQGKLGGATGTWSAHCIAYPNVNWLNFSKKFIKSMGLEPNLVTTQIENHDSLAENYHIIERINTILIDFTRDVWLYIMRGVLGQTKKAGEIGSSTMPHKINPIQFENAEGNLGIANAYFAHLAQKLPTSRLQRDLTDSTVLRNQGVPLAHSLLAAHNILKGMSRLTVNSELLNSELESHWEVLAEAIQTILRKVGYPKPYEKLKELTRGQKMTKETIREFIKKLDIPKNEKEKLLKLSPQTYIGLAKQLASNSPLGRGRGG